MKFALIRRAFLLTTVVTLVAGCSSDPNKKKVGLVESGQEYFQMGKYAEAGIQFRNAIQVDQNYAEAHYPRISSLKS